MVLEPVLECSFLIPIFRDGELSDGKVHKPWLWDWIEDELHVRFGGFTVAPGRFRGSYTDPDTEERVSDESVRFTVAVTESRVDELRNLLSGACVIFQQKCIYLSIAGQVEFIEPAKDETS
jgi:hypothetical protein